LAKIKDEHELWVYTQKGIFEKIDFLTTLYNILHILENKLQYSAPTDLIISILNQLFKKPQSTPQSSPANS